MRFVNAFKTAVGRVLLRGNAAAFAMFNGNAEFRQAVLEAVNDRFREDNPEGGLIALLNWIVEHQEEILAIVKALMVLFV
jgi:hypothetical protein